MINILLDNNFKINIERNNDYMKNISKIMVTALSCFMIAIPITNNIYADEENTSTEYQSLQVGDSYSVIEDIDALGFPADYDDFVDKIKEIKACFIRSNNCCLSEAAFFNFNSSSS